MNMNNEIKVSVVNFNELEEIECSSIFGFSIKDGELLLNGDPITETDIKKLKSVLNKINIISGLDKLVSEMSDHISSVMTNLGDYKTNIIGRVVPINVSDFLQVYTYNHMDIPHDFDNEKVSKKVAELLSKEFPDLKMEYDDHITSSYHYYGDMTDYERDYIELFWETDSYYGPMVGPNGSTDLRSIMDNYNAEDKKKVYNFYTIRDEKLVDSHRGEDEIKVYKSKKDLESDYLYWLGLNKDLKDPDYKMLFMILPDWNAFMKEYDRFYSDFNKGYSLLKFNGYELSPKMVVNFIALVNRMIECHYNIYLELTTNKVAYVAVESESDEYVHPMSHLCNWGGRGGETMAGVLCGACSRMVYRYYNDGDTAENPSSPTFDQACRIRDFLYRIKDEDKALLYYTAYKIACPGDESIKSFEEEVNSTSIYDVSQRYDPFSYGHALVWGFGYVYCALVKITDENPDFMKDYKMESLLY